jgi:DNA-binding NarL/FixJ family response regulator
MQRKFTAPTDAPPYRVLLVEDHAIVREGIAAILSALPSEFFVCGQADTSRAARELATRLNPHLIVLDYFLGDGDDGARLIADLSRLCRHARLLVLSLTDEDDLAERALRAGAHGYLVKSQGATRFLAACRVVLGGGLYVSPELQARLLDQLGPSERPPGGALQKLTDRELQIFQLLGANLSTDTIATRLGLSVKTVATHRENLKNKLGHGSTPALLGAARAWLQRDRS